MRRQIYDFTTGIPGIRAGQEEEVSDGVSNQGAWGHITRTVVVFIAALVAGALVYLWMFEAAFANASPSVYDAWIFPLAVLFGACLLLALIEPNPWVITAAASFPALAVTSFLMVSLWLEGRNDWHWPAVIVTVVLCSGAGAFSGSWLRTRK